MSLDCSFFLLDDMLQFVWNRKWKMFEFWTTAEAKQERQLKVFAFILIFVIAS